MGGRLISKFGSALVTGAMVSVGWHLLLDERARESVRRAAREVSNLAAFAANTYMKAGSEPNLDEAKKRNQEWVRIQWKQAGF